jgi:uncharacterized iron-regulated membrane protein
MDFIERIFGVSPDGGNGLFELMLVLLPVLVVSGLWMRRRRGRHDRDLLP